MARIDASMSSMLPAEKRRPEYPVPADRGL